MAFWNRQKKEPGAPAVPVMPQRLLGYQVANLQEIGTRQRQEDSFAFVNATDVEMIQKNGMMALMADGMGGMKDGKVASETAIASMKQDFLKQKRKDIPAQLRDSVLKAGKQVCRALQGEGGCTMVACVFFQEQLYYASVGDSFLYLLRDGQLVRMNRLQNLMNERWRETIQDGSMDPEPGRTDRQASALSGFLGMPELEDVDYLKHPLRLRDGDRLLLCSDGVAGVLSEEALLNCMSGDTAQQICAALREKIFRENRKYQDNFTALIIRCSY